MNPVDSSYKQYMYAYPHKMAYRDLGRVDIRQYLHHLEGGSNHLYIHLPFCQSKCGFCNLFSVAGMKSTYVDNYLDAVERQLMRYGELDEVRKASFSSLVVGGGTPLLLKEQQLEHMFHMVEKYLPADFRKLYIVIETSPTQSDESKLRIAKSRGVDRISLGIQSFVPEELDALGRFHSVDDAHKALKRISLVGFDELNIDLIYGIPGQTVESIRYSVEQALSYKPREIFAYPLYLKAGTSMHSLTGSYKDARPEIYSVMRDILLANGYWQTSMRRFVLGGVQQSTSCGFDNILALGCGGRSYLGNLHFCEPFSVNPKRCRATIDSYIQKDDFYHTNHGYILNEDEQKRRYVIKNLLFHTGINKQEYYSTFKSDITNDFLFINDLEKSEHIINSNNSISLTPTGLALSDHIGPMFISAEVQQKMDTYQL